MAEDEGGRSLQRDLGRIEGSLDTITKMMGTVNDNIHKSAETLRNELGSDIRNQKEEQNRRFENAHKRIDLIEEQLRILPSTQRMQMQTYSIIATAVGTLAVAWFSFGG